MHMSQKYPFTVKISIHGIIMFTIAFKLSVKTKIASLSLQIILQPAKKLSYPNRSLISRGLNQDYAAIIYKFNIQLPILNWLRSGQTNGQKNEWPFFMANGHLAIHHNQDSISGEWPWLFTENRILWWGCNIIMAGILQDWIPQDLRMEQCLKDRISKYKEEQRVTIPSKTEKTE